MKHSIVISVSLVLFGAGLVGALASVWSLGRDYERAALQGTCEHYGAVVLKDTKYRCFAIQGVDKDGE